MGDISHLNHSNILPLSLNSPFLTNSTKKYDSLKYFPLSRLWLRSSFFLCPLAWRYFVSSESSRHTTEGRGLPSWLHLLHWPTNALWTIFPEPGFFLLDSFSHMYRYGTYSYLFAPVVVQITTLLPGPCPPFPAHTIQAHIYKALSHGYLLLPPKNTGNNDSCWESSLALSWYSIACALLTVPISKSQNWSGLLSKNTSIFSLNMQWQGNGSTRVAIPYICCSFIFRVIFNAHKVFSPYSNHLLMIAVLYCDVFFSLLMAPASDILK